MEKRTDKHQEQNEVWGKRGINGGKEERKDELINRKMEGRRKRKNRCEGNSESKTERSE